MAAVGIFLHEDRSGKKKRKKISKVNFCTNEKSGADTVTKNSSLAARLVKLGVSHQRPAKPMLRD